MPRLLKKHSEPNLQALKTSIDTRITAILKYLNNDSNFTAPHENKQTQTTILPQIYDI